MAGAMRAEDREGAVGELLAWDTRFFGHRIGRLRARAVDRELLERARRWCREEAIDCLYFLADAADPATAPLAEADGFRLVDLRVTLEGGVESAPASPPAPTGSGSATVPGPAAGAVPAGGEADAASPATGVRAVASPAAGVRAAVERDIPALRRIAAASHHDSRFYSDPHFARPRCDELYATWIENSCRAGQATAVLVADLPGYTEGPAGYITCQLVDLAPPPDRAPRKAEGGSHADHGQIGLFAVAPGAQGRGVGGLLIAGARRWFAARGVWRLSVVTQGRNVRAQRIYQRHGLLTRSVELWYHKWFREGEAVADWSAG
jgi:dTDP-4-amino-4,6-dideoxy-D-galactose acyltransferase